MRTAIWRASSPLTWSAPTRRLINGGAEESGDPMRRRVSLFAPCLFVPCLLAPCLLVLCLATLALAPIAPAGAAGPTFTPGSSGVGDPYYPLDGNGGYDVANYGLDVRYDPASDVLTGTATITARATQDLSAFNLDLVGLTVRSVTVDKRTATFARNGQELTVTPARALTQGSRFTVVVHYDGVPAPVNDSLGISGFIATDDGFDIAGEPHVAATWFPANDHPSDKASFSFQVTVPAGLEVVANGKLDGQETRNGWTTWEWEAKDPMATYLATVNVGEFDLTSYRSGGIQFWDAIDPDLLRPVAAPTTGTRFALSQPADSSYKRLLRPLHIPAGGATVNFSVSRDTEPDWDYFFVEVHTVGQDDWTTLADQNGHTSADVGFSCLVGWQAIHPFLAHYQTDNGDGTCRSTGTSGQWLAASGASGGPEQWQVSIPAAAAAARDVEVSLSYASDEVVQYAGAFVDDVVVSTGEGSTSFEADADPLDGWTVPGPPTGSPGNSSDWTTGTAAEVPPGVGQTARDAFKRQPEILAFLAQNFGPYPFKTGGGIVDDVPGLGFALETQTRPIYSSAFFREPVGAASVVVHENAHQWFGDSLALQRWRDIWLNEGFASYAEWLWSEHEGQGTAQETFEFLYGVIPDDSPFWSLEIGDPGTGSEFDGAVYTRGAMTLQVLRNTVGDRAFFRILQQWANGNSGGNVTTDGFIALAERLSGQELSPLFDTWLHTTTKPALPTAAAARTAAVNRRATAAARVTLARLSGPRP
jgi:Peptidase family M1 domain/Peptidase M1 N-terminal domain